MALTSERFQSYSGRAREIIDGIPHYRTAPSQHFRRRIPFVAELDEMSTLKRRIREVADYEEPDIVHAHSPSLVGAASERYCRRAGVPFVYEVRAFWEDAAVDRGTLKRSSPRYVIRRWHETTVSARSEAVVTISEGLSQDLRRRGISPEKIHVIRNGVDPTKFAPVPADRSLAEALGCSEHTVIGFIGSFFRFEGLQFLIRAVPTIRSQEPVIILLVGDGPLNGELRNLAQDLDVKDAVIFTGRVPHDQVKRYYSLMDIVVYPRTSKRITELVTPLKPLEAMSMEKAVIMSDVGGLKELVHRRDAVEFFEPEASDQLAQACINLIQTPEKRTAMGRAAREEILAKWGWDQRARSSIRLYKKFVG